MQLENCRRPYCNFDRFSINCSALNIHVAFYFSCFAVFSTLIRSHYLHLLDFLCLCLSGLNALPFDPASNNDPLHFSSSGGPLVTECPPLENTADNTKKRKRASLPPGMDNNLPHKYCTTAAGLLCGFKSSLLCSQPCRILNASARDAQQRIPAFIQKSFDTAATFFTLRFLRFLYQHQIPVMGIA